MTPEQAAERLLGAVKGIDGLRPATPSTAPTWFPGDREALAIDVDPQVIEIRLIAARLPLPPLLDAAAEAVRAVLAGTSWENAALRLVVKDLDGAAFA